VRVLAAATDLRAPPSNENSHTPDRSLQLRSVRSPGWARTRAYGFYSQVECNLVHSLRSGGLSLAR